MAYSVDRRMILGGLAALPACRVSGSKLDAKVIVLGAGLAGLHAARLLSARGEDVLVLEGSSRIGGRVHTVDHGPQGYVEGGGANIRSDYNRIVDTARQLGVKLIPAAPKTNAVTYFYQGQSYTSASLKQVKPLTFPPPFEGHIPSAPLYSLAENNNPLKAAEDWLDPRLASYDISAQDFLSDAGFNGDAQKVIEQTLKGNNLRDYSMINLYQELYLTAVSDRLGSSFNVKGGAQRLTDAMAASLSRKVKTEQEIKTISVEADKVIIETAQGKIYRAAQCICALPFGALRHVFIKAFMPEAQSAAIRDLPYTQLLQVHLKAKTRFWEEDGLPPDMWTDLPLEQLIAERDTSGNLNGLFRIVINGRTATRSIWTDHSKIAERVKAYLKTVRPASDGQFEMLGFQDWTRTNRLAGGANMHWAPGQISRWAGIMGTPSSRLAFAGAHLGRLKTGMEGAMESSERAVNYLLN